MKLLQILGEEGKKEGIEILEESIIKAYNVLEQSAPRLIAEGEGFEKTVGLVLGTALPVFKSVIEKLADLNKDGKIG